MIVRANTLLSKAKQVHHIETAQLEEMTAKSIQIQQ